MSERNEEKGEEESDDVHGQDVDVGGGEDGVREEGGDEMPGVEGEDGGEEVDPVSGEDRDDHL